MNFTIERMYVLAATAVLVAVLGVGAYALTWGSEPKTAPVVQVTSYPVEVLTVMRAASNNVFIRTASLTPREEIRSDVTVSDDQLGKADLARPE
jgi:hypothetical protein